MCYAAAIRAYIAKVPLNVIFSTREVLNLGTRAAVDLTLSRMVKARTLIRVARGLFVREGSIIPGAAAIAKAKALAFGRSIASHGSNEARRFGFDKGASDFAKFCIGGGSSSFLTIHERVNFAGTCDRKRHLGDSAPGKVIRGFWYMGKDKFLEVAGHCINSLPLQEQTNVAVNAAWMPAWMSDQFIRRANSGPISISVKSLPPVSNSPQS